MSSDEDGMQAPARPTNETRRVIMDDISDDESDDGRLPMPRTPSPTRGGDDDDDDDDIKAQRSDSDDDRARSSDGEMGAASAKIIDAHERRVLSMKPEIDTVELLHFPAVLQMEENVAKDRMVPEGETYPISFRPKRGVNERAIRSAMQRGPMGLADLLESNARLVEWSDGSHTIMVGDEHYTMITDKLASDYFLFRKGEDVQTVEAEVSKVGRLQLFGGGGMASLKKSVSTSGMKASNGKLQQRRVLLTMKEGGEQEEKLAREEAERKERDRARMENKRRASMASHRRSEVPSPRYEESEEDEEEAERYAEEKERQIKRQRLNDWSFKTKKAGRRKIVGDSDDEEEEDESEDD